MTTIAANRESIACDLQLTYSGSLKFKMTTKILTVSNKLATSMFGVDKAYIGFCGNADKWARVVEWFAVPDGSPPKIKGLELLMLTSSKELFHATTLQNWMKLDTPFFSIGSGCHLALAAMEAGKTPKQAIAVASKFDVSTGMGCKVYKV